MIKLKHRDYLNLSILTIMFLIIVLILTHGVNIYGSMIDWQNQFWVFSEYFRNLFYSTHNLLPNFAFNIGGGQNIYHFSYYGLFNPVILLSYFLPFIPMMDYVIATSILSVIACIILFYILLKQNGYSATTCFIISLLFLLSGPLIFQSHRQLMFINYMPFLLLCLFGVDLYYKRRKSLLLIISVFLMIMTSYYFSVVGMLVIAIYAVYKYLVNNSSFRFKKFIFYLINLAIRIILGVLMSCILILPTFMGLINGRKISSNESLFSLSLFIPHITLENILYSPYSIGLSAISIIAILYGFLRKKADFFLSAALVTLLIFPFFEYLMNGTLYFDTKVFIPFLPIACFCIANLIEDINLKQVSNKKIIIVFLALAFMILITIHWKYNYIFITDGVITGIAVLITIKSSKMRFLYISLIIISSINCIIVSNYEVFLTAKTKDAAFSKNNESLIESVLKDDTGFFRVSNNFYPLLTVNKVYSMNYYQTTLYSSIYNKDYYDFYYNILNNEISNRNFLIMGATNNILFDMYMGNKYDITDSTPPIGYRLVKSSGGLSAYENDNVFPLGYATNQLMSEAYFDQLQYPYNVEALLHYGVINGQGTDNFTTNIETLNLTKEISATDYKNLSLKVNDGNYNIQASDNASMELKLNQALTGKLLFIRIHMDLQSDSSDTGITINGTKNLLTSRGWKYDNNNYEFDYVISSNNPIDKLSVEFMKGEYKLSGIEAYTLDYASIKDCSSLIDPFIVDTTKTHGDKIYGTINAKNDGYFILNIPYDKGFTIKVDGKPINYEMANKAFIGFKISKGESNIDIAYRAPLQKQGLGLSLFGTIMVLVLILVEKRKKIGGWYYG